MLLQLRDVKSNECSCRTLRGEMSRKRGEPELYVYCFKHNWNGWASETVKSYGKIKQAS